jgi:hypothetical protein
MWNAYHVGFIGLQKQKAWNKNQIMFLIRNGYHMDNHEIFLVTHFTYFRQQIWQSFSHRRSWSVLQDMLLGCGPRHSVAYKPVIHRTIP